MSDYRPQVIHYDGEGDPYWQFVERDVPTVTGQVFAANVEMIMDFDGNVIGSNIYYAAAPLPSHEHPIRDSQGGLSSTGEHPLRDRGEGWPASGKYDITLKPFVAMMEAELHANAGKGDRPGWLAMGRGEVLLEIYYHLAKLQKAVRNDDANGIREYAADVANMSMMAVDICGAWPASLPPARVEEGPAWQPIDDDTKTPALVCRFDGSGDHNWLPMTAYRTHGGKWQRPASRDGLPYEPTHWHPFPAPPALGSALE